MPTHGGSKLSTRGNEETERRNDVWTRPDDVSGAGNERHVACAVAREAAADVPVNRSTNGVSLAAGRFRRHQTDARTRSVRPPSYVRPCGWGGDDVKLHNHTWGAGAMMYDAAQMPAPSAGRTNGSGVSLVVMQYEASDPVDVGLSGPDAGVLAPDPTRT